jgi:hypothetical protein
MDNSACYFIDTAYGPTVRGEVRRTKKTGNRVMYDVPMVVMKYNLHMAGVDINDQTRAGSRSVEQSHRNMKWTHSFFYGCISFCVANSYNAWRYEKDPYEGQHGEFTADLYNGIIRTKCQAEIQLRRTGPPTHPGASAGNEWWKTHDNVQTDAGSDTIRGGQARYKGNCVRCPNRVNGEVNHKRRTSHFCDVCLVFVHPECHRAYHISADAFGPPNKHRWLESYIEAYAEEDIADDDD